MFFKMQEIRTSPMLAALTSWGEGLEERLLLRTLVVVGKRAERCGPGWSEAFLRGVGSLLLLGEGRSCWRFGREGMRGSRPSHSPSSGGQGVGLKVLAR